MAGYKERIARSSYRFKLPKPFEEYFDRLYFDMAGFEGSPIALRCALEGIRPERLVFATDYPQNFNNSDPSKERTSTACSEYIDEIRAAAAGRKGEGSYAWRNGREVVEDRRV